MTYLVYIVFTIVLTVGLILVSYLLSQAQPDSEKVSAYECGFSPLGDARQKFDVSFYLIAILFIIFDLEVVFILPFASVIHNVSLLGGWITIIFLVILTIGFIYEFVSGAITDSF
uniref:NADH-ubiquinone oxidoreductase chain 3 n=1 Tax=Allomyces macrogynus TaxID=28583 RepID=NU3M_ALLMA|nr:NADH dehydrogenase, subunit 3 [Allomyces macrogynus]Q37399.1 RecName: Full=NADH-ubiquinone oxidoreductase chain 3; AltName: Full=NADH dehydrogenase subunit 3 [Allomyces macrogynus]AAC49240.1 NADH dehydrogenase, subunit 3 [Allomyces macrogynus]